MTAEKVATIQHRERFTLRLIASGYWCDWELYQALTWGEEPREYWPKGATSALPSVTDIDGAECELSGFVKWDGCHEFHVDGAHGCDPRDARETLDAIAWAMSEAWRAIAREQKGMVGGMCFDITAPLPDGRGL